MTRIFVCAGMKLANDEHILKQARLLGERLSKDKSITYVQGGSDKGLMGETLKAFLKKSKNVEFLIPDVYYKEDSPSLVKLVGEKHFQAKITKGEAGRLYEIIHCDKIIVFPGGTGTLEELLYSNETHRSGENKATITVVNIDGFFDGVLSQIKTCFDKGLADKSVINFNVVDSVEDLIL